MLLDRHRLDCDPAMSFIPLQQCWLTVLPSMCLTRQFGLVSSVAPVQVYSHSPEASAGSWTRNLLNQLRCLRQLVIALSES